MLGGCVDLRDYNVLEIRTAFFNSFNLHAGHREQFGEGVDVRRELYEFAKPADREFHVWRAHAPSRAPNGRA